LDTNGVFKCDLETVKTFGQLVNFLCIARQYLIKYSPYYAGMSACYRLIPTALTPEAALGILLNILGTFNSVVQDVSNDVLKKFDFVLDRHEGINK
jgi:hypothetical protein